MKKVMKLLVLIYALTLVLTACGGGGGGDYTQSDSNPQSFTVSVQVSGLKDTLLGTLVLQNNNTDDLSISTDGTFTFATSVAYGSPYSVTVKTQPSLQTCSVSNGTGTISGAADVTVTCAIAQNELTATDGAASDEFGYSVSMSSDGNSLVVGAPRNNSGQGAAYAYKWNGTNWVGEKLTAWDGAANDGFGVSASLSPDGNFVVVGADAKGAAYVYEWYNTSWYGMTELTASDGAAGDFFGFSVSLSQGGSTVIVGAQGNSTYKGAAYVYKWNGTYWTETKLTASDGATYNYFGWSVSMSSDGNTVVSGAYGNNSYRGAAYLYKWNGLSWVPTKLIASDSAAADCFGHSVSLSPDGNTLVVGADGKNSYQGAAYVYKWNGTNWAETKLTASDGAAFDYFGNSVSVSPDGNTVFVGAKGKGAAYMYKWTGTSWAETKLTATDGSTLDNFGYSVSSDGAAVGADTKNSYQGAVYVYK